MTAFCQIEDTLESFEVVVCDGPLLYFKFDGDFESCDCEKVEANQVGDNNVTLAWVAKMRMSASFNGAAVLVVPFIQNFFANRNLEALLWLFGSSGSQTGSHLEVW